jgi:hypothetical protein
VSWLQQGNCRRSSFAQLNQWERSVNEPASGSAALANVAFANRGICKHGAAKQRLQNMAVPIWQPASENVVGRRIDSGVAFHMLQIRLVQVLPQEEKIEPKLNFGSARSPPSKHG